MARARNEALPAMSATHLDPFARMLEEIGGQVEERDSHFRRRPVGNPAFQVQFVSEPSRPLTAETLGGLYLEELVYDPGTAAETAPPPTSTQPADIVAELAITSATTPEELHRLRRRFALANHPDRLAPHHRDSATRRMMIANRLIDEALAKRH